MSHQWTYAFASAIGTSHTKTDSPMQDFCLCEIVEEWGGFDVLIAVVSDGAGSAPRSQEGAELTCHTFVTTVRDWLEQSGLENVDVNLLKRAQTICRNAVVQMAEEADTLLSDYACTLIGAIVWDNQAALIQVGDGAVVYTRVDTPEKYELFTPPAKGEYANTTYFLTDAEERLEQTVCLELIDGSLSQVALFTDGIERLCLDFKTETPFAPFFDVMFRSLMNGQRSASELSNGLGKFLASQEVNSRTDDDKTLVLAMRLPTSTPLDIPA